MRRGFTLIELLVVLAIIAILSAIVISSVDASRVKARDAARMALVHQVQNALQLYATQNGSFPVAASPVDITTLNSSLSPAYIQTISYDTTNVSGITYYRPASSPDSYLIYVSLEHQTQASPPAYGCRTGQGTVVDSGLYATAPKC